MSAAISRYPSRVCSSSSRLARFAHSPGGDGSTHVLLEHLPGGAEVANVRHARSDEHLVNLLAHDVAELLGIVGIVGATHNRLSELHRAKRGAFSMEQGEGSE